MGDTKGFLKIARQDSDKRALEERVCDYNDVCKTRSLDQSREQATRCMDCATPFCHWSCPVGNYISEWNDLAASGDWKKAAMLLEATNNLPEVTGRVCPALCEYSCVLGINDDPVTVRENELCIVEKAFKDGLIKPIIPEKRTGKKVAVIGSGPAGLSCAAQLNKAGHKVTVFERDKKAGGILRYGIPDFKLEKHIIDRRINLWKKEGIIFNTGIDVGKDYLTKELLKEFNSVLLACGSRVPRDLNVKGRELKGIYFAMDYLTQANKKVSGETASSKNTINAENKKVIIIGGGDTGADCVGTAKRQGAKSVTQIEVMPRPDECRTDEYPWPLYPLLLKESSSHQEGCERKWSILTKKFLGKKGVINKLSCVKVEFVKVSSRSCPTMKEIKGSEFDIETDMVILAIGFLKPEHEGLVSDLKVGLNDSGTVRTEDTYKTSVENVFSAGDMRRGQSLVVWAILEGRKCAHYIDRHLMGKSNLPLM